MRAIVRPNQSTIGHSCAVTLLALLPWACTTAPSAAKTDPATATTGDTIAGDTAADAAPGLADLPDSKALVDSDANGDSNGNPPETSSGWGLCGGMGPACSDGNPCTADYLNPNSCKCVGTPMALGQPCTDDDKCTTDTVCSPAGCTGTATNCDDGSPCTTDSCLPEKGCVHTPLTDGGPCDDNDACTIGASCLAGTCGQKTSFQLTAAGWTNAAVEAPLVAADGEGGVWVARRTVVPGDEPGSLYHIGPYATAQSSGQPLPLWPSAVVNLGNGTGLIAGFATKYAYNVKLGFSTVDTKTLTPSPATYVATVDACLAAATAPSGAIVAVAKPYGSGPFGLQFWAVDQLGAVALAADVSMADWTLPAQMARSTTGALLMAAKQSKPKPNTNDSHYFLVFSADYQLLATALIGGVGQVHVGSIVAQADGGWLAVVRAGTPGSGGKTEIWHLDPKGQPFKKTSFSWIPPSSTTALPFGIGPMAVAADGSVVAVGSVSSSAGLQKPLRFAKLNLLTGSAQLSVKLLGGNEPSAIAEAGDGGFWLLGSGYPSDPAYPDYKDLSAKTAYLWMTKVAVTGQIDCGKAAQQWSETAP